MFQRLVDFIRSPKFKEVTDVRNIGVYVFVLIVLAVFWSGVKTVQTNYQLQQKVATLEQENENRRLENENLQLKNKFLETDQYLELSARRNLSKAGEGETVVNIPQEVALKFAPEQTKPQEQASQNQEPGNFQAWINFLLGRTQTGN